MKKILILLFFTLSNLALLNAQTKIEAIVVDEEGNPAIEAIAFRLDKESKNILQSVFVDSVGRFSFGNVDFSKEFITVTCMGYKAKDIVEAPQESVSKILLSPLGVDLNEIVIVSKSSVIQKSDRLIFNITNENLVKGNNTYQLLKFTPLIQTTDNKISIVGNQPAILYINGRKSNLSEEGVQGYLQSLPADRIASIEVITNPGASYKLEDNQGIINLILKKDEADGVKGSLSIGTNQNNRNSQSASVYLDYQKDKLNLTANIYPSNNDYAFSNITDYYYFNADRHDNIRVDYNSKYFYGGGNIRADYHLSEDHILGILFDGSYGKGKEKESANTIYSYLETNSIDSIYDSYNNADRITKRWNINANYRAKISEKGNLAFDFDFLTNNRDYGVANDFYRQPTEVLPALESAFNQKSEDITDSYSVKVEYKHRLNNNHSLTIGSDFYYATSESDFFYHSLLEGQCIPDPGKNNFFKHKETFTSAYVSYNWKFGNKLSGMSGVRIENVNGKGNQLTTGEQTKRDYFDIMPSLSVMYTINAKHKLSYNFTHGVSRPSYHTLNSFKFFVSPTTYREYNPNLKAPKSYNNRLIYTFNSRYIASLNYRYISQSRNDFMVPVDNQYTKLINTNYGNLHLLNLNLSWNDSFFDDYLYMNLSANGNYRRDKGSVEAILINNSAFSYSASLNLNWTISKKQNWNVSINSSYDGKSRVAGHESNGSFDASVECRKTFPNDISLSFGVSGLLRPMYIMQNATANYTFRTENHIHYETAFISLSIPFGNQKAKGAQNRGTSSSKVNSRLSE